MEDIMSEGLHAGQRGKGTRKPTGGGVHPPCEGWGGGEKSGIRIWPWGRKK